MREPGSELDFFLAIDPPTVTAQQKGIQVRGGKPVYYTKPAVKAAADELMFLLAAHRPREPFSGAVALTVSWRFRARSHKAGTWRTTRPDTDNLNKLLKDCMTEAGFWQDDAQVVQEHIEKLWSNEPGIRIKVEEL